MTLVTMSCGTIDPENPVCNNSREAYKRQAWDY